MKGNLILIDDEVMLLEKTAMLLEDIADKVFTADSGAKGLEIIKNNKIHCILCDINMPNMNGVEVLKKIRELKQETPFIFYTGHGSRELMKEAIKYGALDLWADAVNKYNAIPQIDDVNPDLADHVSGKALVGLFDLVEKKELGIRSDLSQRTSSLLEKVFAKQNPTEALTWTFKRVSQGQSLEQIMSVLGADAFSFDNTVEVDTGNYTKKLFFEQINGQNKLIAAKISVY